MRDYSERLMLESAKGKLITPSALLLAVLFLAWQLPGIIGRAPWKSDEAYTMGLVYHVIESGDVVVPELGGEPFMQKPPVFFVTAAAFAKLLSPLLPLHDGARVACLLFNLLTLIFVGLAARELNGPGKGWPAAVLFMACIGPIHMAHFILTDLALVSGMAIGLYGMAVGMRRAWVGGLICGTGAGLAFMAKGLLGAGLPGLTVLLLPLLCKSWRNRNWIGFTIACVIAALPWATIWPVMLFLRSPQLFSEWMIDNNFGRFHAELARWLMGQLERLAHATGRLAADEHLIYHNVNGPKGARGYLFALLPWYAFPATLLVAWTLLRERLSGWASATLQLPAILFLACFLVFSISSDGREIYALPLMVPLLVLASRRLDDISPKWMCRLNGLIFGLFSLVALFLWLVWTGVQLQWPAALVVRLHEALPGYEPAFNVAGFSFALMATLGWVALWFRHQRDSRHLCVHMAAGVSFLYLLGMTIFLPMADWNMSYSRQLAPLRDVLPKGDVVVASKGLGEPQRAMLEYYAGLKTARLELNRHLKTDWLLIQSEYDPKTKVIGKRNLPSDEWKEVWRDPHNKEIFLLFRRIKP